MKLLAYFKELTLHPKNADELKGLILQLAVQGKLTQKWREENPDVEPASVLLEKLEIEKKILIKEGKIRKEQPLDSIGEDEVDFSIPNSWGMTRLGEIGDWGAGATPSRSRSDFYGGTINWFKSGELNNGIIDYKSEETINELALKNSSLRLNKVGDILIAMYGATIGKTGILAVEGTTNQAVCACTPFSSISNIYLHLLLKALKEKFINQGEGGAQPNISRVKIRNQVFALPPLAEQKAIVEVVNQLFAEVEQLEALTKERVQLKEDFVTSALNQLTQTAESDVATHWELVKSQFGTFFTEKSSIKKLREAILQLAVQGKLTRAFRESYPELCEGSNSAAALLEKIKAEKEQLTKAGKIKKEKPLPPISEEEIPYELPEGWIWCRYLNVASLRHGHQFRQHDFVEEGIPVVKIGQCKADGTLDLSKADFIDQSRKDEFEDILIYKGDLLMALTGGTLGKVTRVDKDYGIVVQNYRVGNFIANDRIISLDFLNVILESELFQRLVRERINQNAQPNIGKDNIEKILMPIPPKEEQNVIVQQVNALMALCDQLEKEIETHHTTQEDWMQSCLREVV